MSTPNDDAIVGTDDDDIVDALAGDDTVTSSRGSDTIRGGDGNDTYVVSAEITPLVFAVTDGGATQVSIIGDIDGDGLDDFVISDAFHTSNYYYANGLTVVVSSRDLLAADAADGTIDGNVDIENVVAQINASSDPHSFQIFGPNAYYAYAGEEVNALGDLDGDGAVEFAIVSSGDRFYYTTPSITIISTADLDFLDDQSSSNDGAIEFDDISSGPNSYIISGGFPLFASAPSIDISIEGGVDALGSGEDDFGVLITGSRVNESFLTIVASDDLAGLDASSGTDNEIAFQDLLDLNGSSNSYSFVNGDILNFSFLEDVDGDGKSELSFGDRANTFIISSQDLVHFDTSGGTTTADGFIDVQEIPGLVATSSNSIVVSDTSGPRVDGTNLNIGDLDGDGIDDFAISAYDDYYYVATMTIVASSDLAAFTEPSGIIDIANLDPVNTPNSFKFTTSTYTRALTFESLGDLDGDGDIEYFVGSSQDGSFIISASDLSAIDADGDGIIDLSENSPSRADIVAAPESFAFSSGAGNYFNTPTFDVLEGDGSEPPSILFGSSRSNSAFIFNNASNLEAADAADGVLDGRINLGASLTQAGPSVVVSVDNNGDGTVFKAGVGVDTVSSVESFVAGEAPSSIDAITLTEAIHTSDIGSDLDTANVVGTYTTASGTVIAFGGSGEPTLATLLAQRDAGTLEFGSVRITGGDETGTIGNISFENFETINFELACFGEDTLIQTENGDVKVQDLCIGEKVLTLDNGYQPIKWIKSKSLNNSQLEAKSSLRPIRIKQNALGKGFPSEDLIVSPQHRILLRSKIVNRMCGSYEVLIAAKKLLPLSGVSIAYDVSEVKYYHFLFDDHQIVYSNGALTESLFTGPQALEAVGQEAKDELLELFPELFHEDFIAEFARPVISKSNLTNKIISRHQSNRKSMFSY